MEATEVQFKTRGGEFLFWVVLTLLFVVSFGGFYIQYHGNQNDYLLLGLASGPVESLADDWFANTKNPEPVFSFLVNIFSRLLSPSVFYLLQFAILGIFLFSLFGIADHFFHIRRNQLLFFAFFSVFLFTNTPAFINFLHTGIYYGLAGQGLALHEFLPNIFGTFLFLSLYLFLKNKYIWAILSLCFAGYIHIGYDITAALLTFSYMFIIYRETKSLKTPLLLGLLALIIISPIVIHTFNANADASLQQIQEAARIIVQERIPHHTQVNVWWNRAEVIKTLICLLALFVMRKTKIFWFLLFGILLVYLPVVALAIRPSNSIALLQIWRASVLVVPVSSILLLGALISFVFDHFKIIFESRPNLLKISLAALVVISLIQGVFGQINRIQLYIEKPTWNLYAFVKEDRTEETTYLIPPRDPNLEDFRLGSETPIVADWKSHPWNAVEAVEWYQRITDANAFYANDSRRACELLPRLISTYQITNILSYAGQPLTCENLDALYQDSNYIVYRVND